MRDAGARASVSAPALNVLLPARLSHLLSRAPDRHAAKNECPLRDPAWMAAEGRISPLAVLR
jgi:hypothetical protein